MQLNDRQIQLIDAQIKRMQKTDNYYGNMYKDLGIKGISSQEEFETLPFSSKADLRNAYPLGIQAVPDEEVVRIHSSSGTTGKPVIIPYTKKDVDDWATMFARCYETAGITNKDRIQITPGYGLWTAGIGFQAGCEKLGAMAVPMGPGNTDKQLQMMMDLETTVITATSSYALLLAEEINKRDLKKKIHLKKGVIGSERWSEKMRNYIRENLGIELYDIYGLTEIYGPGIGINCSEQSGMHYWDDYIYIEILDPVTLEPVPDGEMGEIVITTLVKEGAPLIRYRTHDLSRIIPGECPCGSGNSGPKVGAGGRHRPGRPGLRPPRPGHAAGPGRRAPKRRAHHAGPPAPPGGAERSGKRGSSAFRPYPRRAVIRGQPNCRLVQRRLSRGNLSCGTHFAVCEPRQRPVDGLSPAPVRALGNHGNHAAQRKERIISLKAYGNRRTSPLPFSGLCKIVSYVRFRLKTGKGHADGKRMV